MLTSTTMSITNEEAGKHAEKIRLVVAPFVSKRGVKALMMQAVEAAGYTVSEPRTRFAKSGRSGEVSILAGNELILQIGCNTGGNGRVNARPVVTVTP